MVNDHLLIHQDLQHIWHPCSQMKEFEKYPPFIIKEAKGSHLYTSHGPIIDGISSWWCKSLGHGHPKVIEAIQDQLRHFEHVITANTTNSFIVDLAMQLKKISGKQHVFFASDGSSAVEIALKLALHASHLKGYQKRTQFISLKNSYHGETLGTLNVSDSATFSAPFYKFGPTSHHLQSIPYVSSTADPLWDDCSEVWPGIYQELESIKEKVCAIIVEPIVQGVAGMLCYSADFLKRLALWAKENDIYFIADEIMTGLGRTGEWLACQHANVHPDLICLSKGLTSGSIPLSCVLIDTSIFNLFYHDYVEGKSFLHSHTYSGNPLAVRAALATLQVMHEENINQKANKLGQLMHHHFSDIAQRTDKIHNIRQVGALIAGDFCIDSSIRKGPQFAQEALSRGALLRPIGNTLYWLPPLTTNEQTIEQLAEITLKSLESVF